MTGWSDIRAVLAEGRAAEGAAAIVEAALRLRLEGERLVEDGPPETLERTPDFVRSGRFAAWFDERLPPLAEAGWSAALAALGWRGALRGDLKAADDYAAALAGHAARADGPPADLLRGASGFFAWLAYDLSRRMALKPPRLRPASGPLHIRGDLDAVGVVGGAEFTETRYGPGQ